MDVILDQAIYGYDAGHRLLVSSTKLDKEADRVLRAITDLKIGAPDRSYLTIAPLPPSQFHSFARTWSAGPGFRPGSVWSHVLLMRQADLDHMETFVGVLAAFKRPEATSPQDLPAIREAYSRPVALPDSAEYGAPASVSSAVAKDVVTVAYGDARGLEIVVNRASDYEHLLVGLLDQAWPELRRDTAVRTRHRRSGSSIASFSTEIVERPSTQLTAGVPPIGEWVVVLANDLERPDPALRHWLHTYGRDAGSDRSAVRVLTDLYGNVSSGDTTVVLDELSAHLSGPRTFPRLNRALFGRAENAEIVYGWPSHEGVRLSLALRVIDAIDEADLQIGPRLTDLVRQDPAAAVEIAMSAPWSIVPTPIRTEFFAELASAVAPEDLVLVAVAMPEIAKQLLQGRPDAWSQPELWNSPETAGIVAALLMGASDEIRRETFVELALSRDRAAAGLLVREYPELWWSLFEQPEAPSVGKSRRLAEVARELLAWAGPDRIGTPTGPLSPNQLGALLAAAPAEMPLWEFADPPAWLDLARGPISDHTQRVAAQAFALAAAERSKDLAARELAWTATFAGLHHDLEGSGPPPGAERALEFALPSGPSWDWCARLREGLARIAVKAGWPPDRIQEQARGAGAFADDVLRRVQVRVQKQDGTLEKLFRLFWP